MSDRQNESRFDWLARWTGYWVIIAVAHVAAAYAIYFLSKLAEYLGI